MEERPIDRLWSVFRESYRLRFFFATIALLYIMVLAMVLMKRSLISLEDGNLLAFVTDASPLRIFGIAWGSSLLLLSGSPVAAVIVGLSDSGVIGQLSAVFGIMGTRVGSVTMVFLLGGFLILRGKDLKASMGIGMVSFIVAATMAAFVLLAAVVLESPLRFQPAGVGTHPVSVPSFTDQAADAIIGAIGPGYSFALALLAIFFLMDRLEKLFKLRDMTDADHRIISPLFENPATSFALGFILTGIFLSVSVTIGLLVPLYDVKRIKRRWAVPYIIAANISTFLDTLILALSGGNPGSINVVSFCIAGSLAVGFLMMYKIEYLSEKIVALTDKILGERLYFVLTMLLMLAAPLALSLI